MSGILRWRVLLGLAVLVPFGVSGAGPGASAMPGPAWRGRVDAGAGVAAVEHGGKPRLVYAFAATQYKPYVRELWTADGRNVLRDAPADHLHHHGLMLALRVNGVNFWEERDPAGRQVPEGPPELEVRDGAGRDGGVEAVLSQWIRWLGPGLGGDGAELLRERRVLRFFADPTGDAMRLDWDSDFRPGPGVGRVVLHGPDYHGLGMRLPAEFDHVAEFLNGEGLPFSEAQTYDVRPGRWTAVTGPLGGARVQLVLAQHPGNPGRHSFFSMRNAFAYLAATPEPSRYPLEFGKGDRFSFRYRLWIHSEPRGREALEVGVRDGWAKR